MNVIVSIIIQALIFAVAHGNMLQGIYTFVLGIVPAFVYMWTKSIWANILINITLVMQNKKPKWENWKK